MFISKYIIWKVVIPNEIAKLRIIKKERGNEYEKKK